MTAAVERDGEGQRALLAGDRAGARAAFAAAADLYRESWVQAPATAYGIEYPFLMEVPAADGDLVYVSFSSTAAKDRAATIFDSGPWRRLAANRDNRIFVVNNEIWQTGEGVVAARGVIDDLRWVNAPIN